MNASARVVILGGGFAGLETAYTLRHLAGDAAAMTLVSDAPDFLFKPNTIYLPFGGKEDKLHIPLARPLASREIGFQRGRVAEVDPDSRRVGFLDGTRLSYDFLVVATGSAMRPDEVPGLAEHAETIWTPSAMTHLGHRLREIRDAAARGEQRRVLFVVPPGNKCAGPLYEVVFMLETWLRRNRVRDRVELSWTTYEQSYIQAFGPRLHEVAKREFAARGIEGHTGAVVAKAEAGEVTYTDGTVRPYDLLIAFPPYGAAVDYPGLPSDERGFLRTEMETRKVQGHDRLYAPGDAGDFPVKQAFLAFLQADAAAASIAGTLGARRAGTADQFEPTSMCVMEMFNSAAFAQVPLETTGDPDTPVRVRADVPELYRVGVSPLWRLGKKTLGIYLPLRFRAGRPFHAGLGWTAMNAGLTVMSRVLASGDRPRRSSARGG